MPCHALMPVMARLSNAVTSSASAHDQPSRPLRNTISVAISSNHADAPNAIATPVNASVRPSALRASDTSAKSSVRNALAASLAASRPARPAAPTWRSDSPSSGVPATPSPAPAPGLEPRSSPDGSMGVAYLPLRDNLAIR